MFCKTLKNHQYSVYTSNFDGSQKIMWSRKLFLIWWLTSVSWCRSSYFPPQSMVFSPSSWECWCGALVRVCPPWVDMFGYTSLPTSSLHQCFPSNFTLVCSPLSALTEVLLFPSSRHSAAQQAPAPLQGPDHSALICFPNLSLSGISAVTQKQLSTWIICLFLSPLLFSSVYFLYLSISLPLLDLFLAVILRCDGWPTEPTLSALAGSCCDCV